MRTQTVCRVVARAILALVCTLAFAEGLRVSEAAEAPSDALPPPVVVLDTGGFWRVYHAFAPPVIDLPGGLQPVLLNREWLDSPTSPPPAGWAGAEFDDGGWRRGPARIGGRTPYMTRLCLRGKFEVLDSARTGALALSLDYHGGAVVYVNGTEVARANLPAGALDEAALADGYPPEAFVTEEGAVIGGRTRRNAETTRRVSLRLRSLKHVSIPARLLRKGVNVLGIKIVRAPYNAILDEKKGRAQQGRAPQELAWNTCELVRVQLTSPHGAGLLPNATRPKGLQVWNSRLLAGDRDTDYGDPTERLRPVRIVAARNGSFSGKVVVGSNEAVCGLRAVPGDLKGGGGAIPAAAVRIRYGIPWGRQDLVQPYSRIRSPYPTASALLGGLVDEPLTEFPVRGPDGDPRSHYVGPDQPEPVAGAVVPVWITVDVPAETPPGEYTGTVTVRADGAAPVAVPVKVQVAGWTLPDPQDYRTWVELIQSPDTLAVEYGVEMWSEEHFRLIEQSMKFLGEVGSRVLYVPLICETNFGNAESMVRWIDRGEGRYDHDFSAMERYLNVAQANMGTPKIVALNVWDIYMVPKNQLSETASGQAARAIRHLDSKDALLSSGPLVSVMDPTTGRVKTTEMPPLTDPESKELWAPLLAEVRRRLQKRGLRGTMMLASVTDVRPSRAEVEFFEALAPDVPWVSHSHHGHHGRPPYMLYRTAGRIGYQTHVWNVGFGSADKPLLGWKRAELTALYERNSSFRYFPPARWFHAAEIPIMGDQRGPGRIGADWWFAVKDERGRRRGTVASLYPHSSWRNLDLWTSLLGPGPDGPMATNLFEIFREGLQLCEARIAIEDALHGDAAGQLGEDLTRRAHELLRQRALLMYKGLSDLQLSGAPHTYATAWRGRQGIAGHNWFLACGWQDRTLETYRLAARIREESPELN